MGSREAAACPPGQSISAAGGPGFGLLGVSCFRLWEPGGACARPVAGAHGYRAGFRDPVGGVRAGEERAGMTAGAERKAGAVAARRINFGVDRGWFTHTPSTPK